MGEVPLKEINMTDVSSEATVDDREKKESILIAQRKLEILSSPNLTDFAVRFANIHEYKQVLSQKSLPSHQASRYMADDAEFPSFLDYLKTGTKKGWVEMIKQQTDWAYGTVNIETYRSLMALLKLSITESRLNDDSSTTLRVKAMKIFGEKIVAFWQNALVLNSAQGAVRAIATDDSKRPNSVRSLLDGSDISPENVRKAIRELSYSSPPVENEYYADQQYHLAMIFGKSVVAPGYEHQYWVRLAHTGHQADGLLGAIAVMPDRELVDEITRLSSNAQEWSHPIFDNDGNIKYPREVR